MINENYYLQENEVKQYLEKIGMQYPLQPTIENLRKLQCNHLATIPYENLNILYNMPISLQGSDLFKKMIIEGRGGFCFELNALFQFLLKALGYKVSSYHTRLLAFEPEEQLLRHRLLKVDFDHISYISDVGIRSESPRYALRLIENEIQTDGISKYRFICDDVHGWIFEQKKYNQDWKPVFAFQTLSIYEKDYVMPTFFCEKHPDSPFLKGPQMSIFPKNKHITVANQTFIISDGNRIVEKHELTESEFETVCLEYFHININELKNI